jgi:hypothetical protein
MTWDWDWEDWINVAYGPNGGKWSIDVGNWLLTGKEIVNLKANSNCSPCWPQEASWGAACLCHSSLREVDLLSLHEGQEMQGQYLRPQELEWCVLLEKDALDQKVLLLSM